MKKLLFIDFYNTISTNKFWEHLPREDYDEISERLFGKNLPLVDKWMRGKVSTDLVIKSICCNKYDVNFLKKELYRSCTDMKVFDERVLQKIHNLRKKKDLKIVVATDNMPVFKDFTVKSLNLSNYFDDFLISSEIGSLKNDTINGEMTFFSEYMKSGNLSYEECTLIDDSITTIELVRNFGMTGIHVKNPSELYEALDLH